MNGWKVLQGCPTIGLTIDIVSYYAHLKLIERIDITVRENVAVKKCSLQGITPFHI